MVSLKNKSVLISGASGYIGGVIAAKLHSYARNVFQIDKTGIGTPSNTVIPVDLTEPNALENIPVSDSIDIIIHVAAILPGQMPDIDILLSNQLMTHNLLEWGIRKNIKQFLFASTCNIYGYKDSPCEETRYPDPDNLYGVSKLACEQLITTMTKNTGIVPCILRISAPYGPNQRINTVVKHFVTTAASSKQPITLMGSGKRSQDFVFESDVANAFILAMAYEASGIFNLGGAQTISMKELAELTLRIFNRDVSSGIVFSGEDPQENYQGIFPIHAARDSFGYAALMSIEEGVRQSAKAWGLL